MPKVNINHDSKNYVIENDFGNKYKLILNPFLTFYGETILYYEEKADDLTLSDYGKLLSLRKIKYDPTILPHLKHDDLSPSNLETNIYDFGLPENFPISELDIHYMIKAVKEVNGIAMLRILPFKFNDYKNFGSSKIKILKLPLKDINYEELPLSVKIDQTLRDLKRKKIKINLNIDSIQSIDDPNKIINLNFYHQNKPENEKKIDLLLDNEELTQYFQIREFYTLESYKNSDIKHLIKSYNFHNFSEVNVKKDLIGLFKALNINSETGYGFNLLITKEYMFVAPLVNPFIYDKNNVPIFAEPHFFAGVFTLPMIEAEWPDTIKSENVIFDLAEVLKKSTNL